MLLIIVLCCLCVQGCLGCGVCRGGGEAVASSAHAARCVDGISWLLECPTGLTTAARAVCLHACVCVCAGPSFVSVHACVRRSQELAAPAYRVCGCSMCVQVPGVA